MFLFPYLALSLHVWSPISVTGNNFFQYGNTRSWHVHTKLIQILLGSFTPLSFKQLLTRSLIFHLIHLRPFLIILNGPEAKLLFVNHIRWAWQALLFKHLALSLCSLIDNTHRWTCVYYMALNRKLENIESTFFSTNLTMCNVTTVKWRSCIVSSLP